MFNVPERERVWCYGTVDGRSVIIGGRYHHFKGKDYIVLGIGHDSETDEEVVIYQDEDTLDDEYATPCVRPLKMFLSEVDHEKYPDVEQKYRFDYNP